MTTQRQLLRRFRRITLIILAAFLWEAPRILETQDAGPFNWWIFTTGMVVWAVGVAGYLKSPKPA